MRSPNSRIKMRKVRCRTLAIIFRMSNLIWKDKVL